MTNIYIDESGSITKKYEGFKNLEYFIISLVIVSNKEAMKKQYKKFVRKNLKKLKEIDTNKKMFKLDSFKELKGCCFTPELKKSFVDFFLKDNEFELYFIVVENKNLTQKICQNKARAFNYILCKAIESFIKDDLFTDNEYFLHLDERNEKTEAKYFLENYLNTQVSLEAKRDVSFNVRYYDSANCELVQLADVFANLYYSSYITESYREEISKLKNKTIKKVFEFPEKTIQ